MSKRENHWYLINNVVQALGKAARPRGVHVGVWLFLVVAFVIAYATGALDWLQRSASSPMAIIVFPVGLAVAAIAGSLVVARIRQSGFVTRYRQALASPTLEPLMQVVEQAVSTMKALPDADALGAHARALACSLYGDERGATHALARIDWRSRAPLIQSLGLNSEGVMALLCRRDARRFLELTRQARAQASVSTMVPGSAQSERYFNTCVAVGEALLDLDSPRSRKWLEESAADTQAPALQLLASLGLAVAVERSGDTERAGHLRSFLRKAAPHCAALQLKAEDFAEGASRHDLPTQEGGSVTAADAGDAQARAAKQKLFKLVGFWALLLVMYAVMYVLFSRPK
jgi:hypothetical protein